MRAEVETAKKTEEEAEEKGAETGAEAEKAEPQTQVRISCCVTREDGGDFPQDEVVQLYFSKKAPAVKRPVRQLVGFERVKALQPGESRRLEFVVPVEDLKYYDTIQRRKLLEPGEYEFQLAKSSQEICATVTIALEGNERGQRRVGEWQPADHYDRCANGFLWEGHLGCQSVVRQKEELLLEYELVAIPKGDFALILDVDWEGEAEITVFFDGEKAAELALPPDEQCRHGHIFRQKRVPVQGLDGKENIAMRLVAGGKISICRWKIDRLI
jgi:beta-glucosidase